MILNFDKTMKTTIRLMGVKGEWIAFDCEPQMEVGEVKVPELKGTWLIHDTGMMANVGGNDWRIYDLHPEDCARICHAQREQVKQGQAAWKSYVNNLNAEFRGTEVR